jgi:hypothetical protein
MKQRYHPNPFPRIHFTFSLVRISGVVFPSLPLSSSPDPRDLLPESARRQACCSMGTTGLGPCCVGEAGSEIWRHQLQDRLARGLGRGAEVVGHYCGADCSGGAASPSRSFRGGAGRRQGSSFVAGGLESSNHYNRTTPTATHVSVSKHLYWRCWYLYQRI